MSNARGRFCWYDLMTPDPKRAVPFNAKVVGWGTIDWKAPDSSLPPCTMWANGETMLGGVMELPEEAKVDGTPPMWVLYIATPDIEATVKRGEAAGWDRPQAADGHPDRRQVRRIRPPQGATFCVFQSDGDFPGHDGPRRVGEFSWHELATTDSDAAFRFYSDLFGWVKTGAVDMGPAGSYQMFGKSPDLPLGGIYRKPDEIPVPGWLPYVRVDDVHEAVERVKAGGGNVIHGPVEVPGGDFIAHGIDPQGARFVLHSRPA